jgi:bacterioferritin (cytochrome b1)
MRRSVLPLLFVAFALVVAACSKQDTTSRTPDLAKLKKLHRGELAAIDSYDEAIKKFPSFTGVDLAKIRADHADAAERLRGRIVALAGTPDLTAGPWGDWSEAVTKAGSAFGEDAGLRALQAGEQHGKNEYNEALSNAAVDADTKQIIRDVLLPRQEEHLTTLKAAIKSN